MAINKELYERYKAMKAAKLAAGEGTTSSAPASEPKFQSSDYKTPEQKPVEENKSGWTTTYSTPDDYSQTTNMNNNYTNTENTYNNQFAFSHPKETACITPEIQPIQKFRSLHLLNIYIDEFK